MLINDVKIPCSQDDLYAICNRAWNSYQNNVDGFAAFNPKYTQAYGTAAVESLRTAMGLPNHSQRRAEILSLHRLCGTSANAVSKLWKKILRYIANAFLPDQVEPARMAIGAGYYTSVADGNLKDAGTMFSMALTFITANEDKLINGGNGMPAGFVADFEDAKGSFDDVYSGYTSLLISSKDDTSEKGEASAALYITTINMMNDGKIIFEDNANLIKQFTFAAVLRSAGKQRETGLRFSVKEIITELPVSTATLQFQPGNVTAYTDKNGIAKVKLPEGKYSCTITMPGFNTVHLSELKTKQSVMRRVEVTIIKAAAEAGEQMVG